MKCTEKNQMTLNLSKTLEMLLKQRSPKVPPAPIAIVDHKTHLILFGVTFAIEANLMNWDTRTDHVLI